MRFGLQLTSIKSRSQLVDVIRQAEAAGYAALFTPDHFAHVDMAAGPMLNAAAQLSQTMQMGTLVYCNDFRHPLLLAREVATLDVLSEGRAICGIGAGWMESEYRALSLPFDAAGVRIRRLAEAIGIIKAAWAGQPFSHQGEFYQVQDFSGLPLPITPPPLLIGGGGQQLLALAAREADIINLTAPIRKPHTKFSEDLLGELVGRVKDGAGSRFSEIELSLPIFFGGVTDNPDEALERAGAEQGYSLAEARLNPSYLFGSPQQIKERIAELGERFGISLFILSQWRCDLDNLAPVVRELSGTPSCIQT